MVEATAVATPVAPAPKSLPRRAIQRLRWQRVGVGEMRLLNARSELRFLIAYTIAFVGWSAATGWLIRHHPMPIAGAAYFTQDWQYVFLFKIPGLLVIPAIWFFRRGYRARDLLPRWRWERRTVVMTLFAFAAGVYVNSSYVDKIAAAVGAASSGIGLRLAWGALVPLISAGLPEEFVYRGLLQTRLEAIHGRLAAIFVGALLFTAWHLPTRLMLASGSEGTAGDPLSVMLQTGLPVFAVSLVLAWLWDRYRSLVPMIALHWGIDLLPSLANFFGVMR